MNHPLRGLPSVNAIVECPELAGLATTFAHARIVESVRAELDAIRAGAASGNGVPTAVEIASRVAGRLQAEDLPHLRQVINATGIVLHTNLGRAPMAEPAARAAYDAARAYLNLELDLTTGKRSSRQDVLRRYLTTLTGAESATAVNNCAAATVLTLRALAAGREVIVSRGQLIEIGGSFRIPEIMGVSGAALREVGTTNITRARDYEQAIGPQTAALMRIHTSNYRVTGFTESASLEELIALGKKHGLPVIDDVGSGALFDDGSIGFGDEPLIRASIQAGADLVLFSGDKLLGGPQAGLIVGRADLVHRLERDPLMRAFRLDKMTLAALEATLRLYRNEDRIAQEIPILRMLTIPLLELRKRAESLARRLGEIKGLVTSVREELAYVGGGSMPERELRSAVVTVSCQQMGDELLAERLRLGRPALLGRVQDGQLLLDVRTLFPDQNDAVVEALRRAVET